MRTEGDKLKPGRSKNKRDMGVATAWRHQSGSVAALMTRAQLDPQIQVDYPPGISIYSPSIIEKNLQNTTERFYTLREDTFFGTPFKVERNPHKTAKELMDLTPPERTESIATLRNIKILLGIKNFSELPKVYKDSAFQRNRRSDKAKRLLAVRYGIMGTIETIREKFDQYGEISNNVVQSLRQTELSEEGAILEMMNDVKATHDPVSLLLMTLDDSYSPKVRFEAKRKLELMRLIAEIQLRDRRYGFAQQQQQLNEFFTNNIYTQEEKKGQTVESCLLCDFDPKTFETLSVRVIPKESYDQKSNTYLNPETNKQVAIGKNQKVLSLPRRTFNYKGRTRYVYTSDPPKELERKTLKQIRKGYENPTQVIDDDIRMMGVFDTYTDAQDFIAHIQERAAKAGTLVTFEQIEDTLKGGKRRDKTGAVLNGGNKEYKVLKFHASFAVPGNQPIFAEFQLHVNNTWVDSQYRDEYAWEEFGNNRFFGQDDEIGAADTLFPYRHYLVDMKLARERKNKASRQKKRQASH